MELKVATIYTIDRENNTTTKNVPEDDIKFNEYLHKVLITMANNKIVKNYKSKAKTTQVINCIKDIIENQSEPTVCEEFFDSVSMRLLEKERSAQSKIEKMEKSVQVGSLIQALFYDRDNQRYMFLLAKVAHVVFAPIGPFQTMSFIGASSLAKSSCVFVPTSRIIQSAEIGRASCRERV